MKKSFLFLLLALVSSTALYAYGTKIDGIYYTFSGNEAHVTYRPGEFDLPDNNGYYSGSVVIPPEVSYNKKTYPVKGITWAAFTDCPGLTSVTIPESVTSIEEEAFGGCIGLCTITIPSSVTKINKLAFRDCYFTKGNFINNSAVPLEENNCFGATICDEETSDGLLLVADKAVRCRPWATAVTIPEGVTSIGNNAFYDLSSLTSVTIPGSVTSIGSYAFRGCSSLTSITIPNSVTSIGNSAFSGCSGLTSITIPGSVTSIGNSAFSGCSGLTSVAIGNSVTNIGDYAFSNCSSLTSVIIPNSVTSIGNSAFSFCRGLTSITIPNSVTSIGKSAFLGCSSLTSIAIPNSVTSISEDAFSGCSSLTSVTIPNSVTSIGEEAFSGCSSLTSITIPNSVTSIGEEAFSDCSSLTSITIPNSVTSIGNSAFSFCSSLTSVAIPNSVTSISNSAFYHCSSLTSVIIPKSVTSIGDYAFDCGNLISVTVDIETPLEITSRTFDNWVNATLYVPDGSKEAYAAAPYWKWFKEIVEKKDILSYELNVESHTAKVVSIHPDYNGYYGSIEIPAYIRSGGVRFDVTGIGEQAFRECSGLLSVTIPESVTSIGMGAFAGCTNLTDITIPGSVSEIAYATFSDCYALSSVVISEGVKTIGIFAFFNCTGLTSVTIPKSVTNIANGAFYGCSTLPSITIPEGVTNIGTNAFYGCTSLTSVIVGIKSPLEIGEGTFSNRANATLYVPAGCKDAYEAAPYWKEFKEIVDPSHIIIDGIAYKLYLEYHTASVVSNVDDNDNPLYSGDITIPASITYKGEAYSVASIDNKAFYKCKNLTSVNMPSSIISIGMYAFDSCEKLTSINIPSNVISIGMAAFWRCESLTSITIPEGVTTIGKYTFADCDNLNTVSIPSSVTNINDQAFMGCYNLTSVTVYREKPLVISGSTFANRRNAILYVPIGCTSAYQIAFYWEEFKEIREITERVTIDNVTYLLDGNDRTATVIDYKARNYTGDVTIPASITYKDITFHVTSIGDWAFMECSISSISLPESLTSIGAMSFFQCVKLASITIPNSVSFIGVSAFQNCAKLTSVSLPESLTYIYTCVFDGCKELTTVVIPEGVNYIEEYAFSYCPKLAEIYCNAVETPQVVLNSFYNEDVSKIMLVVPEESYEAYKAHDVWGQFWIETPTGIRQIGNGQQTADNGQQLIYNPAGQRLNKMQRGINIINGKKVLLR